MVTQTAETLDEPAGAEVSPAAAFPPPPPPRPGGGRSAWTEPRVRAWWLVALGVFLAAAYVAGREVVLWRHEADLIRSGTRVEALVLEAGGYTSPGKQLPPTAITRLRYEVGGKTYEKIGFLRGRAEHIAVKKTVPIRINPNDPDDWTGAVVPAVLWQQLTGALVALPVFLALAAVTLLRRRAALRAWRHGEARAALVVESRHTALAPKSRLVRCTPVGAEDNRVVDVYVPQPVGGAAPKPGDALWVVYPPGSGPGARPYAAAWFDRRTEI